MKKVQLAGFWRRVGATLIDSVLFLFICFPIQYGLRHLSAAVGVSGGLIELNDWLVSFGLTYLYSGFFLSRRGATPGKAVMNLRVVDHETGAHLSFSRAGFRGAIGGWISLIPLGIGVLMVAFRSDKRALHDLIFGSDVWYTKK